MNKPDCRTCGICCVSLVDQDSYVDVTPEDEARMSRRVRLNIVRDLHTGNALRTVWIEQKTGPLAGVHVCQCSMLRGSLMNHVSCRI